MITDGYFKEDGKTFYKMGSRITRTHDDNFNGPRFKYKRCPFCSKLTSMHTQHWFQHLNKCADNFYNGTQLLEMRYESISKIRHIDKDFKRK